MRAWVLCSGLCGKSEDSLQGWVLPWWHQEMESSHLTGSVTGFWTYLTLTQVWWIRGVSAGHRACWTLILTQVQALYCLPATCCPSQFRCQTAVCCELQDALADIQWLNYGKQRLFIVPCPYLSKHTSTKLVCLWIVLSRFYLKNCHMSCFINY